MSLTNFSAPSSQQDHFAVTPQIFGQRSVFDRTHGYKTTFDAGYLIPFMVDEILPGDTFKVSSSFMARLSTPIFPIMDNLYMDVHYWFVPNRLVWDNWERFQGAQDDPNDTIDYLVPTITSTAVTGYLANSIFDYMGLPTEVAGFEHIALPLRGYNLIFNEWYRDQNLQNSVTVNTTDSDVATNYTLLRRGKRHDYFTSCLPAPQKGDAIDLPLGGNAPVKSILNLDNGIMSPPELRWAEGVTPGDLILNRLVGVRGDGMMNPATTAQAGTQPALYIANLQADLSGVTAATVNDLRQAFQLQRLLEKDARGGTRYVEMLKSQFNVIAPDFRLQRPEFLGGGRARVNITQVAQTSASGDLTDPDATPQGNMAAFGTILGSNIGFVKSFVEHGYLFGILSVRADMNYQQGLNRMWSRQTRYDYYMPVLAHLGEQAVLSKEIYCDNTAGDETVFGYQERWAEYRYKPNIITGEFRSNYAQPLDSWHLAQNFASRPELDDVFIVENPPVGRVLAVDTEPHFILDSHHKCRCARPMPTYSVPGMIDHF